MDEHLSFHASTPGAVPNPPAQGGDRFEVRREDADYKKQTSLRRFANVCRLRSFLALRNFELNYITFLEAFIAIRGDCAVVDKNIRSIVPTDETVAFRVIEPLDRTFQTFHVRPLRPAAYTPITPGARLGIYRPNSADIVRRG